MIVFDLKCSNGHTFEGWFDDSRCDKSLSDSGRFLLPTGTSGKHRGKIADFVENNFEDVACKFTTEALKMHYGVSELRNIRGTSTEKEEKILKDEGINFFKIPMSTDSNTDT